MTHTPRQIVSQQLSRTASLLVVWPVRKVFPLFTPLGEKAWAHGWDPFIIWDSQTDIVEHMVFLTHGGLHGSTEHYLWTVIKYEPGKFLVEYQVTASDRVWFITVVCKGLGEQTNVDVTYSYIATAESGREKVQHQLNTIFASGLQDWQAAINYYIKTGKQLH